MGQGGGPGQGCREEEECGWQGLVAGSAAAWLQVWLGRHTPARVGPHPIPSHTQRGSYCAGPASLAVQLPWVATILISACSPGVNRHVAMRCSTYAQQTPREACWAAPCSHWSATRGLALLGRRRRCRPTSFRHTTWWRCGPMREGARAGRRWPKGWCIGEGGAAAVGGSLSSGAGEEAVAVICQQTRCLYGGATAGCACKGAGAAMYIVPAITVALSCVPTPMFCSCWATVNEGSLVIARGGCMPERTRTCHTYAQGSLLLCSLMLTVDQGE